MASASRRLPIIPTMLVLAAAATMVALGFWQLRRLELKVALIAHYETALANPAEVAFPHDPATTEALLYRRSHIDCTRVLSTSAIAGRSSHDEAGWAQSARCATPEGEVDVLIGWSQSPNVAKWTGGPVAGFLVPAGEGGVRLRAEAPVDGLQPLAPPDPREIPNNHFAYAIQWFLFALTAVVIYGLALRKRLREG